MKKIRSLLLLGLCGIATYGLGPNDFFGIWNLNELPGTDSVFSSVPEYTAAGCSMKSKLDKSELKVVDGPSGKKAIESDSSKAYAEIRRTPSSPSDTVWEYSVAIEFMIPDSLAQWGIGLFSMGNLYKEGLNVTSEGKIYEYKFMYEESPVAIEVNKWYQFVVSVKVGHDTLNDTTGFFTLYLNGKKLCDFTGPTVSFLSGGWYSQYHLFESFNIGVATISYVALLNKTVDSAEVVELQKDYFQAEVGTKHKIQHSVRTPVISIRQNYGGIYMHSDRINAGTVKILDIAGRTIYNLNMDKGRAFLPGRALCSGVYVYRLITKNSEQYSGKLAVR